jgi:hypothetical protein
MLYDNDKLIRELELFKQEHKTLDDLIIQQTTSATIDQISLQRLKKRKLWLKDKILHVESILFPDIIA